MRGVIAVASSSASNITQWQYDRVVIDEVDTHLSFPYVFKHSSSWFMTVEAHQSRCVPLYRASQFPFVWEKHSCLLSGATFQDNALLMHGGVWWLWTTVEMPPHEWQQHLYFSERLEGPYMQHPQSPVVRGRSNGAAPHFGCARGRLGGRVMEVPLRANDNGTAHALFRFAQAAAPRYGERLDAWIITVLTRTEYEEHWAGPLLQGRNSGEQQSAADRQYARRSWNANMMHQVDAVQLLPSQQIDELRAANARRSNGAAPRPRNVNRSARWLAVVDGARDGGGLRCTPTDQWDKLKGACSTRLAAALPTATDVEARAAWTTPFSFQVHGAADEGDVHSNCILDNATAAILFGVVAEGELAASAISVSDSAHLLQPDGKTHVISTPGVFELLLSVSAHDGLFVHSRTLRFVVVDAATGFSAQEAGWQRPVTTLLPGHQHSSFPIALSSLLAASPSEQHASSRVATWSRQLLAVDEASVTLAWARDRAAADASWLLGRTQGAIQCAVASPFDLTFARPASATRAALLHRVDGSAALDLSFTSAVFVLKPKARGALWYATLLLASRTRPPICVPYLCLAVPGAAPASLALVAQWELRFNNTIIVRPGAPLFESEQLRLTVEVPSD